jgi:acetyltransferase-like isoleucine patch superfamily enzyme
LTFIQIIHKNILKIIGSDIRRSKINIFGRNNTVKILNAKIYSSKLIIRGGENNILIIEDNVVLPNGIIILEGKNCSIRIRQNTIFSGTVRIVNMGENNYIDIGENCLFSDNIEIWASDTHPIYDENKNFINPDKPIIIKEHVWVGSHVKILKGVTVEAGSIIGMGSLVTKDIPPNTMVAGNPIKILKENISWSREYSV